MIRMLALAASFALASGAANALVSKPFSAFGPEDEIVDFDDFVGSFSSGNGLFLNGTYPVFSSDVWGGTNHPGEANILLSGPFSLYLGTPQTAFGLFIGGNTSNLVGLTFYSAGNLLGTSTITSLPGGSHGIDNWRFYGWEDAAGIDQVVFSGELNGSWTWGVTSFYSGTADAGPQDAAVPLPGLAGLLLAGVSGVVAGSRYDRR